MHSIYVSIPISQFIPPLPSHFDVHTFISTSLSLFLLCKWEDKTKKVWCVYRVEYYSALKRNRILSFVETWMKLENVLQSEVSQKPKYCIYVHLYVASRKMVLMILPPSFSVWLPSPSSSFLPCHPFSVRCHSFSRAQLSCYSEESSLKALFGIACLPCS